MALTHPSYVIDTTFTAKDIRSAASVYTYTAATSGKVQFLVKLTNAAASGDYVIYLTHGWLGAGSPAVVLPKTTCTAAAGETIVEFPTIELSWIKATDVVDVMIDGLAGDSSVNGAIRIVADNPSTFQASVDGVAVTSLGDNVITAASMAVGASQEIGNEIAISNGTCQANAGPNALNQAILKVEAVADDYYNGCLLTIESGTGAGQARLIVDYDNVTDTAIIDRAWITAPTTASTYRIHAFSGILLADTGVAAAVGAATITLASSAPAIVDSFVGHTVYISGGTGVGQARLITAYSAGRVATVSPAWTTALGADSIYKILPVGRVYVDAISTAGGAGIGDSVLDEVVEGSYTLRQMMRMVAAALYGDMAVAGSVATFSDMAASKARITETLSSTARNVTALDGT